MIYVATPSRTVTGGIELLHQLTAELRKYTPAKIWYPDGCYKPQPAEYDEYGNNYSYEILGKKVTVILPEIYANVARAVPGRPVIYWESVDNFINRFGMTMKFPENTLHLVQSEYARQFVMQYISPNVFELSDYINDAFFVPYDEMERFNHVLVNPAKGMKFTQKIMYAMPDVTFIPLQGLSRTRLINLMRQSKLYIDFGDHPGKDRMPREAAMCGCCVITSRNGSASYSEDVGIPDYYKIERGEVNISKITDRIREVLRLYPVDDFAEYREQIKGEKARFQDGVRELAERLRREGNDC